MFDRYLSAWGLTPDGEPSETRSSSLLPVKRGDMPAMLKIASAREEKRGACVMAWWAGDGAARVFAIDENALLLERAAGTFSLEEMVRRGHDDEATRIICRVAEKLHAPRLQPRPDLVPLHVWFRELEPAAGRYGGIFGRSASAARELLTSPRDICVLHGDIHHDNILDFGEHGWLAIDPKGLIGERGFDFANLFCNPNRETALAPTCFQRRLAVVADAAKLDRRRLLRWILAWSGLSAAWIMQDGSDPQTPLGIAERAAFELDNG